MKRHIATRPAAPRLEYDVALRQVAPVATGDELDHFDRLRSALVEWIAGHCESGEIVLMSAGPVREGGMRRRS